MKKPRKAIVIVYLLLLVVLLLYPPHHVEISEGRRVYRGHYPLWEPPSRAFHPDGTRLAIEVLILSLVFGAALYTVRGTES